MKHLILCIASAALLLAAARGAAAAQIGDPAAPLEIAEWVKGDAVNLAEVKGKKVVVVEFWATWCGPCKTSIPHLTEMQKKYADRGVIFIGVSTEDVSKVRPFVNQMADKMDYTVAVDNNGQTSKGYMTAYGANGIPHAFIVDRDGNIAWQGHPMSGLDAALDKMTAGTSAPANPLDKKKAEALRKLQEYIQLAGQPGDHEKQLAELALELTALDKELGGIVKAGQPIDLKEVRRQARFQALITLYQRAVAAGKPADELAKLEQELTPLAPKDFKIEDYGQNFLLQRTFQDYYRAVTGRGDATRIEDLTKRLELIDSRDIELQNEIAWTLLSDEKIKTRNPKLALKFARAAFDASGGKDPNILDTYARALFDNGNAAEAAQQQQRAIDLTQDKDRRSEMEAALKQYREKVGLK